MKRFLTVGLAALLAIGFGLVNMGDVGAATLVTRVAVDMSGTLVGTTGLSPTTSKLSAPRVMDFANGVAAGQADSIYTSTASIATAATLTLDVKGALLDPLGTAFTPAKLKVVYIYSQPANTTNLTLFGDAASVPILNTAATTSTLLPGGMFLMVQPPLAGIAVTATSADIIKIVNAAGATAVVDIIIVGTSS